MLLGGFFALKPGVVHAEEGSFTTLPVAVDNPSPIDPNPLSGGSNPSGLGGSELAVSNEVSTSAPSLPSPTRAVSGEASLTTLTPGGPGPTNPQRAISAEISATTLTPGGPTPLLAISAEISATTLGTGGPSPLLAISEEISTTTPGGPGGPGGPGTPPGGSGGSGFTSSGGGYVALPRPCQVLLHEYIKPGAVNNAWEVIKLQLFLKVYEGESGLRITGVYDNDTIAAVRRFQLRQSAAILTPWGLTEPTGYVFITTKLAINNIFCGRNPANDLDLRQYYPAGFASGAKESGANLQIVGTPDYTNTLAGATSTPALWDSLATGVGAIGPSLTFWISLAVFLILLLLLLVLTRHWGELREGQPASEDLDNGPPAALLVDPILPIDEITTEDHAPPHEDEVVVAETEILESQEETVKTRSLPGLTDSTL